MASEATSTTAAAGSPVRPWPADVAGLLGRAEQTLQAEGPQKALDFLTQVKEASPWVINARGVCLLRLGEALRALELFRGLAQGAGIGLKHDAPTVFKTNYATAQLLADNLTGCIVSLGQARDEGHPSVQRLRAAIRRWERRMSFWERVCYHLGSKVDRPIELDFPPGEL